MQAGLKTVSFVVIVVEVKFICYPTGLRNWHQQFIFRRERVIFTNSLSASASCWKLFQTFLGQNGSENIVSVTNKACKPRKALRFHHRSKLSWTWIGRMTAVKVQHVRKLSIYSERSESRENAPLIPPLALAWLFATPPNRELARRLVEVWCSRFWRNFQHLFWRR